MVLTDGTRAVSYLLIGLVTFTAVDRHRDGGQISEQDAGWNGELSVTVCRPITHLSSNNTLHTLGSEIQLGICPVKLMLSRDV